MRRKNSSSPTTTPLCWWSINPLQFIFYHPRSTRPSGRVFAPFWSENGYICPFWSRIGYGFRSLRKHPFLLALRSSPLWTFPRETSTAAKSEEKRMFSQATYLSFQFQMSKKEREMCKIRSGFEEFVCLHLNLSNDNIISA